MAKTLTDYINYFELIEPKNDKEAFKALVQIQENTELWVPILADRCCALIDRILSSSIAISDDKRDYIGGAVRQNIHFLSRWNKKTEIDSQFFRNKFYTAINLAVFNLREFYKEDNSL